MQFETTYLRQGGPPAVLAFALGDLMIFPGDPGASPIEPVGFLIIRRVTAAAGACGWRGFCGMCGENAAKVHLGCSYAQEYGIL